MSDFPFDVPTIAPSNNVTGVEYAGETLTLTRADDSTLTTTISSGALPFAFAQTDATQKYENTRYFQSGTSGTIVGGTPIIQLSQTITPTSSSQKVLIHVTIFGEWEFYPRQAGVILKRTIGTEPPTLIQPTIVGDRMSIGGGFSMTTNLTNDNNSTPEICNFVYVDSPETTDTITYVPQVCSAQDADFYLNFGVGDSASVWWERGFSTMTLECKN